MKFSFCLLHVLCGLCHTPSPSQAPSRLCPTPPPTKAPTSISTTLMLLEQSHFNFSNNALRCLFCYCVIGDAVWLYPFWIKSNQSHRSGWSSHQLAMPGVSADDLRPQGILELSSECSWPSSEAICPPNCFISSSWCSTISMFWTERRTNWWLSRNKSKVLL